MLKLDKKDAKLLSLLDEHARYSNTQLAKKIGLSKPAIEYRIKRLKDKGAIQYFYTVIDFGRLGYAQYKLYIRYQGASLEDEEEMIAYWSRHPQTVWIGQLRGSWDLAVSVLARSNHEFGTLLDAFQSTYARFILEKQVMLTAYSPVYGRDYLSGRTTKEFVYGPPTTPYALHRDEQRLLKLLSQHARLPIIDLAKKLDMSRDRVQYRMKKLSKEKVIVQYRCWPDLGALGIKHYKLVLRTQQMDPAKERKLKQYVSQHQKATQLLKLIGSWDFEIEFETASEDELYAIINDLRAAFVGVIRDFEIMRIVKTRKYDYFPF